MITTLLSLFNRLYAEVVCRSHFRLHTNAAIKGFACKLFHLICPEPVSRVRKAEGGRITQLLLKLYFVILAQYLLYESVILGIQGEKMYCFNCLHLFLRTFIMSRIWRIRALGFPHHIIQRGNRKIEVFETNDDYQSVYHERLADRRSTCSFSLG
jgi:hypothetical protein